MAWVFQTRLGQLVATAVVAVLLVGTVAAQRRTDVRIATETSPSVKAFEILGPGPLPPRPFVSERVDRPKAATTLENAIDQCVESEMLRRNTPGAAVAVLLDGELLYESGYGVKSRNGSDPVDAHTVFRIGSVTKQMTAAAVMQQVELGRVELGAPVTDYIPELVVGGKWPAHRITVWNTLTHTTGFPDFINDYGSVASEEALSIWAGNQSDVALHTPPGAFWNYSNPNFMIAGLVAERASDTPYRDLLKGSVWEPAGMHSTTFDPSEVVQGGNFSYGNHYDEVEDEWYVISPFDYDSWTDGPAGRAFSTAGDLVRWALLLTDGGGPVLSPWSAAMMQHRHQWMHYTPDRFYGFGIMIEEYRGLDVRQHGGNVAGYGTYLLWVPERRFAVAVLANTTWSLSDAAYCIVDEVLEPPPVEAPDLSTDPSTWTRYVGDYIVTDSEGTSTEATVSLDGNRLMGSIADPAEPGHTMTVRLYQLYLDTFVYDSDDDGWADTDITFCGARGRTEIVKWVRNRRAVGERVWTPRRSADRR
jgi:CubicO group peptidase (beta-lactamase class C family)